MTWGTIERDAKPFTMTFAEFKTAYRKVSFVGPKWRQIIDCFPPRRVCDVGRHVLPRTVYTVDWLRLAFVLRVRVPNRAGYFGYVTDRGQPTGATWCWPWQWYRMYYDVRFPKAAR